MTEWPELVAEDAIIVDDGDGEFLDDGPQDEVRG